MGKSGRGNYKFPIDLDSKQKGSRISFQAIHVEAPSITARFLSKKEYEQRRAEIAELGASGDRALASAASAQLEKDNQGSGFQGGVQSTKFHRIAGEICNLYLPVSFQVNDGFGYQQANLNNIGAAAAGALNSGESVLGATLENAMQTGQSVLDFFTGAAASGEAARLAAVRGITAIPLVVPQEVKSAVQVTARVAMNPNIRTMFNGVAVREFNFQFKFIPTSAQEAQEIKNIVNFFRYHAYPEEIGKTKNFSLAYNYPNMFKIALKAKGANGEVDIGTPIKLCYLKSISTVYNPQSPVLHEDGSPTETDINLTFTEYKALSRTDVVNQHNPILFDHELQTPASEKYSKENVQGVRPGATGF